LKELPSSIGQLNALQKLDLNGCCNLEKQSSFETISNIASEIHTSKFNFALITTGYDMEKLFSCILAKGFKAIGKVNNIL
jgi:hypothetical protein